MPQQRLGTLLGATEMERASDAEAAQRRDVVVGQMAESLERKSCRQRTTRPSQMG